ncbi:DEKNAAC102626 [Brettanomyces naardenensis]|uniref:DEKNAAC102626 n=1 Tax=Brettanomyces naardenensis TaxID=13370 RepID=A0A448YKE9_BRENA|nr:DEKNAAC102626 [Brettanomyces naardenensis]
MANISAAKFLGGVLLVAVPLLGSTYFARPTFANAINSKLVQEEIEKKKHHEFSSDVYPRSASQDEIISNYLKTGPGKAREFKPTAH